MNIERYTSSFCKVCYKVIPAVVRVTASGVMMSKTCSKHGEQTAPVESDPVFYTYIMGLNSPSIYDGYFVDVTQRCNLRCEYCYYDLKATDPVGEYSIKRVLEECVVNARYAPFIITGGEPTTRPDLPELLREVGKIGQTQLVSNGVRLKDDKYFDELVPVLLEPNGHVRLNLSVHRKETPVWRTVLERVRKEGLRLNSAMIVCDSKESFLEALSIAREYQDCVVCWRLKAASRIWHEQKPSQRLYVSEMLGWLEEAGEQCRIVTQLHNKVTFVNVRTASGLWLMLVSWYDVTNVDLRDIECPPYYRAKNGEVCNFVTYGLINEGIANGWLNGARLSDLVSGK